MSTRSEVVAELKRIESEEVGNLRNPVGSNRIKYNTSYYGRRVRGDAYKWCVVFQWWCFQKAGISTKIFPKSAGVFAVRDWFKAKGRFYQKPMPGDLVIYSYSHIGFVEKLLKGGRIQTVEGNWNDGVVRRKGPAKGNHIQGYCRPEYHKVSSGPAPHTGTGHSSSSTTEAIVKELPRLGRDDKGAAVKRLQGLLVAGGHRLPKSTDAQGDFDGEFGDETEKAVKAATGMKTVGTAQWQKLLGV